VNEFNVRIKVKSTEMSDLKVGYRLVLTIDVPLRMKLEKNINELKQYITDNIERFTGILIEEIFVVIDKIIDIS
jgi:uncharacterized alkaline shock family protein YloU